MKIIVNKQTNIVELSFPDSDSVGLPDYLRVVSNGENYLYSCITDQTSKIVSVDSVPTDLLQSNSAGRQVVYTYTDQDGFVKKPLTAKEIAEDAKRIDQDFEREISSVREGYNEDEIKSWDQQALEATAYQKDQTAETPLLDAILVNRGGTKDELVLKIATNATQYARVFGQALGKKQKRISEIE